MLRRWDRLLRGWDISGQWWEPVWCRLWERLVSGSEQVQFSPNSSALFSSTCTIVNIQETRTDILKKKKKNNKKRSPSNSPHSSPNRRQPFPRLRRRRPRRERGAHLPIRNRAARPPGLLRQLHPALSHPGRPNSLHSQRDPLLLDICCRMAISHRHSDISRGPHSAGFVLDTRLSTVVTLTGSRGGGVVCVAEGLSGWKQGWV